MENKTALQELIEIIQKDIEKIELSNSFKSKREKLLALKSYKDIICIIDDFNLLQKEKQQVIEAFYDGKDIDCRFENAVEYYKETYEKE